MFCRIYVNGDKLTWRGLLYEIADLIRIKPVEDLYIDNSEFSIEVLKNDEFDKSKAGVFPDGFLYFPILIEFDSKREDKQFSIELINKILSYLWTKSYAAIASCAFEKSLLNAGGYNNKNVPWKR